MAENEIYTREHLINTYLEKFPNDAADLLATFPVEKALGYLKALSSTKAAAILAKINLDQAAEVLEALEGEEFKKFVSEMDAYLAARLISRFSREDIESRLQQLSPSKAREIHELLTYPSDCAAFMMDTQVTTFKPNTTVNQALQRIRALKDRKIIQVYLVDDEGRLTGVVSLQNIAISEAEEVLGNLVDVAPVSIHALSPGEEVAKLLEEKKLINVPVVDINNHLLGVLRSDTLLDAAKKDVTEDVQAIFGAGREERALSKVSLAVRKRLPWLEINLATAFLAAAVVGIFEDTISRITVLAVFLPVVAGQSGNTGSQALAVTMRGLALREIRVNQWFKVARKEILVGIINGIAVALTTALIVFFWASSFGLAVVIGISMVLSMAIAGLSGALIPILLQSAGQDPASSSSIILTTVTDIVGFLSFLGLATALASALGIA